MLKKKKKNYTVTRYECLDLEARQEIYLIGTLHTVLSIFYSCITTRFCSRHELVSLTYGRNFKANKAFLLQLNPSKRKKKKKKKSRIDIT